MLVFCFGSLFLISLFCKAELVILCGPDEFPCNDGSCVEKDRWCDSRLDCNDDSDELYCYLKSTFNKNPNRCNETIFFLCDDGQCIPAVGRCDGFSSCYDNSDEENCDGKVNISNISASWTTAVPMNKANERSFAASNENNLKMFENSHVHENVMQADAVAEIGIGNTASVVESSNISKSSPNSDLKENPTVLQATHSIDVSRNVTNQDSENPRVSINHRQALDFHGLLRDILNVSRNMQNDTIHFSTETSLDSASTTEVSNKHDAVVTVTHNDFLNDESKPNKKNNSGNIVVLRNKTVQNVADKEEDLEKGYVSLNPRYYQKSKEKALDWLIHYRDQDYGWGDETARALIALYMADYSNGKPNERQLMIKQLHLKLFTLLSRNATERVSLGELALYINALSASCDNPKNFYGHNLVDILRHRTNAVQATEFVTPFVYLVLCLNKVSTYEDAKKINEMLHNPKIFKIDSEAVISLAATCMSRNEEFSNVGIEKIAARKLYHKIVTGGLPTNIYELALMTQALNEAGINQNLWNRTEAMNRITQSQSDDGSFGDILSTYYTLPTLSGKSFLWIGKNCPLKNTDFVPMEILKNGKQEMIAHCLLRSGDPVKIEQRLMIRVQKNTSFMDIMRIAATVNPVYEFKYDMSKGKPFVYSIGGIANDAERGLYWIPYTSKNSTVGLVPFEDDIRNFIPAHGQTVAFWMKPLL